MISKKSLIIISLCVVVLGWTGAWFFWYHTSNPASVPVVASTSGEVSQSENPDDVRIKHMKLIEKSVASLLQRWEKLPLPQKAFDFRLKDVKIGYQGVAGSDFYDAIGLTNLLDPVTETPYNYYVSADRTEYKIFAYLKEDANRNNTIGDKSVFSVGTFSGEFLLSSAGEIISSPGTKLDLLSDTSRKQIGFETFQSCNDILQLIQLYTRPKSGVYYIDIGGRETKVYCDMQTDGGGWTLFYANNGHEDSPIQKSYVQMRDTMSTEPVLDLSNYNDPNLAGLLDYTSFTTHWSKEVLIRNRAGDPKKWVKFSFSTFAALEWALWPDVLGKTEAGCLELPKKATWSIVNNDKKLVYENLTQMMNHGGTSWWVSHKKYLCNSYWKVVNPHLAFYNSNSGKYTDRTRSDEWVWGTWWEGWEYRYFIK